MISAEKSIDSVGGVGSSVAYPVWKGGRLNTPNGKSLFTNTFITVPTQGNELPWALGAKAPTTLAVTSVVFI